MTTSPSIASVFIPETKNQKKTRALTLGTNYDELIVFLQTLEKKRRHVPGSSSHPKTTGKDNDNESQSNGKRKDLKDEMEKVKNFVFYEHIPERKSIEEEKPTEESPKVGLRNLLS